MIPRRFALAVAVLLVTGSTAVTAQEAQDTTRLTDLVVTATRLPTPPDAVVSSVTTISGEDLTVDLATELEVVRQGPGRPGFSVALRVENLFNESYDQVVGFAGRRRGVFGGAKARF